MVCIAYPCYFYVQCSGNTITMRIYIYRESFSIYIYIYIQGIIFHIYIYIYIYIQGIIFHIYIYRGSFSIYIYIGDHFPFQDLPDSVSSTFRKISILKLNSWKELQILCKKESR